MFNIFAEDACIVLLFMEPIISLDELDKALSSFVCFSNQCPITQHFSENVNAPITDWSYLITFQIPNMNRQTFSATPLRECTFR